jgi:hypothetical protein
MSPGNNKFGVVYSSQIRWATLALSLLILLSCTTLCTHIDKPCGDDGKGHCSICLGAAAHGVRPIAAVRLSPDFVIAEFSADSDPLIKQDRFGSSLYIRPPPLS